jgi:putative tryptophan/tyrosine transport system substrate-binding protein
MRRREFITLLGGAAVAWPLAARAQQAAMTVIGFLHAASPEPFAPFVAAFREGLNETRYVEGRNAAIEYRWAENRYERLPALAADLVARRVAVLVTPGDIAPAAAKSATSPIPIVFIVASDPIKLGLVASLNRPGGNITGVSMFTSVLMAKRIELLTELVPKAATIGLLVNPTAVTAARDVNDAQAAGRALGRQIQVLNASNESEIAAAFDTLAKQRIGALVTGTDVLFTNQHGQIAALASRHAIPAIYPWREFVSAGGLASYGTNHAEPYRQAGVYVGRILKGEKPADLPIMQPTKFQLVINLKTAKALGLDMPPTLLARADEVIE